jgi:hypothetical protein
VYHPSPYVYEIDLAKTKHISTCLNFRSAHSNVESFQAEGNSFFSVRSSSSRTKHVGLRGSIDVSRQVAYSVQE